MITTVLKKQLSTLTFFLTLLVLETLFPNSALSTGIVLKAIFSLSTAFLLSAVVACCSKRYRGGVFVLLIGALCLLYVTQMLYYHIFNTTYSAYSAQNAGQAAGFIAVAGEAFKAQLSSVLLMLLPVPIALFIAKRCPFSQNLRTVVQNLGLCLGFHIVALGLLRVHESSPNSPYALYHEVNSPELAVQKLGLLTYMRIDATRLLTRWTPTDIAEPQQVVRPFEFNVLQEHPGTSVIARTGLTDAPRHVWPYRLADAFQTAQDPALKTMHRYVQNQLPTPTNAMTGKYEGYNLIWITAEAFSPIAIDVERTPTLYKLYTEGYNFTNFYTPIWGVSTSDGEYVATTGLLPKAGTWSYKASAQNAMPFAMGNQLGKLGYKTFAYHNHTYTYYNRHETHPNMGYRYKGVGNGLDISPLWPPSDVEMVDYTVPEFIDTPPFHVYYMTVSGHLQYNFTGNHMAMKNRATVAALPYSDAAKAYLATQVELDRALAQLLASLEAAGQLDHTLIALSADHYPYGLPTADIDMLRGAPVSDPMSLYKNAFLLYATDMTPTTVHTLASSVDILPTLSNLMGVSYDSRLMVGKDIFSTHEPVVIFYDRSYITANGRYDAKSDVFTPTAAFSAYDAETIRAYHIRLSQHVATQFWFSERVLDLDYYRALAPYKGTP